jgi:hypothetical protein
MAGTAPLTYPAFNGYAYGNPMGYGPPNSNGPIPMSTLPMTGTMAPLKDVIAATGLDPQMPEFARYRDFTQPINVYDVFNDRIIPFATTDLTVALAQNPASFISSVLATTTLLPGPGYKFSASMEQNFMLPWEPAAPYTPTTAMTNRILSYEAGMTTIQRSVVADLRTMIDPVRGPSVRMKNNILLAVTSRLTMDRYVLAKAFDYAYQNRIGVGPDKLFLRDQGAMPINPAFHLIEESRFGIGNLETPNIILAHIAEHTYSLPPGRKIFVLPPGARARLAGTIQYEKVQDWKAYTSILTAENTIERSGEIIITEATEAFRPSGFGSDIWVEPRDLRFQSSEQPFDPSLVQRRFGQFYILQTADRLARIGGGPFESGTAVAIYCAKRDKLVNLTPLDGVHFSGVFNQASTDRDVATGDKAFSSKFRGYVASTEANQQPWVQHVDAVRRQATGADVKRQYQFEITGDNPRAIIDRPHVFTAFDDVKKKVVPCKYIGDMEPCNFTDVWTEVAGNSVQAAVDKKLPMGMGGGGTVLAGMINLLSDLDSIRASPEYIKAVVTANMDVLYSGQAIRPDVLDGTIWHIGTTLRPPADADSASWGAGFGTYAGISALARANVNMTTTTIGGKAAAAKAQFDALADVLTALFPGNPLLESGNKAWDGKDAAASLLNNLVNHRPFAWIRLDSEARGASSSAAAAGNSKDANITLVVDSIKRIYETVKQDLPNFEEIGRGIGSLGDNSEAQDVIAAFLGVDREAIGAVFSGDAVINEIWNSFKSSQQLRRLAETASPALRQLIGAYLVARASGKSAPLAWLAENTSVATAHFKALREVAKIVQFYLDGQIDDYIASIGGTPAPVKPVEATGGGYYVRVPMVVSLAMFRDIYSGGLTGILASDPRTNYRTPLFKEDVDNAYPGGPERHPDYKRIGMLSVPNSVVDRLLSLVNLEQASSAAPVEAVSVASEDQSSPSSDAQGASSAPSGGSGVSPTDDNESLQDSRAMGDVRRLRGAPRVLRNLAGTQVGDTTLPLQSKLFERIRRMHSNWQPKMDGIVARHNNRLTANAVYELLYTFQPISARTIERFYTENVLIPADSLYIRPSIVLYTQGILISNEHAHELGVTAPYVKTVTGMENGYVRMDAVQERMFIQKTIGGSTIVPDVFIKDYRGGLNTRFFDLGQSEEYIQQWLEAFVDPAPHKDQLESVICAFVPLTEDLGTNVLYATSHQPSRPDGVLEKNMFSKTVLDFYKNAKCHSSVGFIMHATKTYGEDYATRIQSSISCLENPANLDREAVCQVPFILYRGPLSDPSRNQRFDGVGPLGSCRTQCEGAAYVLSGVHHQFPVLNNIGSLAKLS